MKKILLLIGIALSTNAWAQPKYLGKADLSLSFGKNYSGVSNVDLDAGIHGVYGSIFYAFSRKQPLKKENMQYENQTSGSVGYGHISNLQNDLTMAWGLGIKATLTPDIGSNPKTTSILWGPTGYIHLSKESSFEAEGLLSYTFLPKNNQYDWSRSLSGLQLEGIKFFELNLGAGLAYKLDQISMSETQVPNQQFNNYRSKQIDSRIHVFGTYSYKIFIFKIGPEFIREKYVTSQNNQPSTPSGNNWLTHFKIGGMVNF